MGRETITCNYDGQKKSKTTIGRGAFIGSNTALVAPVNIGAGAVIGAGSTIVKDVAKDALAIARGQQVEVPGYRPKKWKNRRLGFGADEAVCWTKQTWVYDDGGRRACATVLVISYPIIMVILARRL